MTVVQKTFGSCCSGESDPICIPERRAAGWFGVDPPCFTDDLLSMGHGESGASVINMGEQAVPIESIQEPAPSSRLPSRLC